MFCNDISRNGDFSPYIVFRYSLRSEEIEPVRNSAIAQSTQRLAQSEKSKSSEARGVNLFYMIREAKGRYRMCRVPASGARGFSS